MPARDLARPEPEWPHRFLCFLRPAGAVELRDDLRVREQLAQHVRDHGLRAVAVVRAFAGPAALGADELARLPITLVDALQLLIQGEVAWVKAPTALVD